MTAVVVFLQAG